MNQKVHSFTHMHVSLSLNFEHTIGTSSSLDKWMSSSCPFMSALIPSVWWASRMLRLLQRCLPLASLSGNLRPSAPFPCRGSTCLRIGLSLPHRILRPGRTKEAAGCQKMQASVGCLGLLPWAPLLPQRRRTAAVRRPSSWPSTCPKHPP